ncbi:MAG: archaellin/type IV pilin N-terminal domain-containing protein [Candidatus Nanoarchaeia archaeon]
MNKRGISPLIATVLLICMVVLIAVVILAWSGTFTRGLLKHADETSEKMTACESETSLNIKYACANDNNMTIMVESLGSKPVTGLIIRVLGSSGGYQKDVETELNIADLKRFDIEKQDVGTISKIEILPKVNIQGKIEICGVKDSETNIVEC